MKVSDLTLRIDTLEATIDRDHEDWKVLAYIQYLVYDMAKMPSTVDSLGLKDDVVAMLCELESEHIKDKQSEAAKTTFKDIISQPKAA